MEEKGRDGKKREEKGSENEERREEKGREGNRREEKRIKKDRTNHSHVADGGANAFVKHSILDRKMP